MFFPFNNSNKTHYMFLLSIGFYNIVQTYSNTNKNIYILTNVNLICIQEYIFKNLIK